MYKLFFDIETLPASHDKHELLRSVFEHKIERAHSRGREYNKTLEEFIDQTTFDGAYGQVFCISYAIGDEAVQCLRDGEIVMLKRFWELATDCNLFIGHSIFDFDLRFIFQRSIIHRIQPSKELSFTRYRNDPIFDIMYEWTRWNPHDKISLHELSLALNIPSPKQTLDGSQVHTFFQAGKYDEICAYCNEDVKAIRAIYKRMTFSG